MIYIRNTYVLWKYECFYKPTVCDETVTQILPQAHSVFNRPYVAVVNPENHCQFPFSNLAGSLGVYGLQSTFRNVPEKFPVHPQIE